MSKSTAPQFVGRLTALLLVLSFSSLHAASPGASEDSLEAFIAEELPRSGAPGVAYAIVRDGEVRRVGARGTVRQGHDLPVSEQTPFVSGSISKSFTALATMQLVEAHEIELDAELSTYLSDCRDRPAGAITIRQLLSHTSGYSTLQGNRSPPAVSGEAVDLDSGVRALARVSPEREPGTTWAYSNANYQILGRVIEEVSGESFESYLQTHILEEVGMLNSFVADGEAHAEMARGHRPWFGRKREIPLQATERLSAPQGGVVASAEDLARYMAVLLNGRDDILSAEGKARMWRAANDVSPHYGFGWFLSPDEGRVWHSGSTPGVESLATMFPERRAAVVVLVNAGSGVGFGETTGLLNGITARALGLDYRGEGSRWLQKLTFVGLAVTPVLFLLCMGWAWLRRDEIRAQSGLRGVVSRWMPLLTTLAAAGFIVVLLPRIFGVPLDTLARFQPDLTLLLRATAWTGPAWALFRLGLAFSGRSRAA
ncbi:MAG: serine hydrolase [Myxococcales bacterium FL481]|nr:MAG: serine hydrolase [Myxococcales bacterium FL481]